MKPVRGQAMFRLRCNFCPTSLSPARYARGRRYNREALEIQFKGKNIAEILDMTVDEALLFFDHFPESQT